MSSNGCFLYSESTSPIFITNSSFTANVNRRSSPILTSTRTSNLTIDARSVLWCPSTENSSVWKTLKKTRALLLPREAIHVGWRWSTWNFFTKSALVGFTAYREDSQLVWISTREPPASAVPPEHFVKMERLKLKRTSGVWKFQQSTESEIFSLSFRILQ